MASRAPMSLIEIRAPKDRFARSIRIERDAGSAAIESYLPVARAIEVVRRLAVAFESSSSENAISVTGPYGSGKSSLAVLLDALLGPSSESARRVADELLFNAAPDVYQSLDRARIEVGGDKSGFIRCFITARREPVGNTVCRAIHAGIGQFTPPARLKSRFAEADARVAHMVEAMESANPVRPDSHEIREVLGLLAEVAPVVMLIDEFGKNLEAFADSASEADLFLLQELAEWSRGQSGSRFALLTMQHLAFDDYASGTTSAMRREWAKVQGRFEDVPFVDSPSQTRALIAGAFETDGNAKFASRLREWSTQQAARARDRGLSEVADESILSKCWPLHPLSLLVLPDLCLRYGQNERTLFSFLAGREPMSVTTWLNENQWAPKDPLESVRLDRVCDYFLDSASTLVSAASTASRWIEIHTRLRDAHGLTPAQLRVAKIVGVLNLVSSGGALRATRDVVSWGAADGGPGTQDEAAVLVRLQELEDLGVLTWRDFADEYRIWQGSDFDLKSELDLARRRLREEGIAKVLERAADLPPLVAARHSHTTGTLRNFARQWTDDNTKTVTTPAPTDLADGLLLYALGAVDQIEVERVGEYPAKPVIAVVMTDVDALRDAAVEVVALRETLLDQEPSADWVAKRELGERLAEAEVAFDLALHEALNPRSVEDEPAWVRLEPAGLSNVNAARADQRLSSVMDEAYSDAPRVRNELLNRKELSTQAAKARRILIEAILLRSHEEGLGIVGFGPERAGYESLLRSTGIHRKTKGNWILGAPTKSSGYGALWDLVETQFNEAKQRRLNLGELFTALAAPPIGLREGLAPIYFTAAFIANSDQVALYEHGTFRPVLTPDLFERLVRNPGFFSIKHFATRSGPRRRVLEAVADELGIETVGARKGASVLAIVSVLARVVGSAPTHIKKTTKLQDETRAVRDSLKFATEPDLLLFKEIPAALGLPTVPAGGKYTDDDLERLAKGLSVAVDEIASAYRGLLDDARIALADSTATPGDSPQSSLSERAKLLAGSAIDPMMRSLISAMSADIDDADAWIEYVAMVISGVPLQEWTDDDRDRFFGAVSETGAAFRRLEALNFEHRAHAPEGFDAVRITVTRTDGREHAQVIAFSDAERGDLDPIVERALNQATEVLGDDRRARDALIAALATGERQDVTPLEYDELDESVDRTERAISGGS